MEIFCLKTEEKASSSQVYSLLYASVKKIYGTDPGPVFKTDEGKPYFKDSDIFFSLSHSNNYALCAVSDHPVGVDIQYKRKVSENLPFAVCSESELKDMDFFPLWSLKESYIKLHGKKTLDFKDIIFYKIGDTVKCFDSKVYCKVFDILPDYSIAVCSFSDDICENITFQN